eukprot:TRINITY_DN4773_c0_g1_i4.p1 TRINITY_DN4773_c0_g1~~TRINITY_DN4773_c0_g1_i4.p1  ORF type:complete len:778 (+),score=97.53 TRINITY_DN4773_c0_g1_i4:203-2335(+)
MSEVGLASSNETPPGTLMELMRIAAEKRGDKAALMIERPCPPQGSPEAAGYLPLDQWTTWTYQQYYDESVAAAKAFIKLGFAPFDSVNVWGFNAPEWVISSVAAGFAGGKVAGLYPTDSLDTAAYKVVHSGGSVVVVEDKSKLEKLVKGLNARGDCRRLKAFVAYGYEPGAGEQVTVSGCGEIPVMSWKGLIDMGKTSGTEQEMEKRVAETQPGHCAGLIYTSGTTGDPKAVMISHDNIIYEATCAYVMIARSTGTVDTEMPARILSYLPLSHVAGLMVDIVTPLVLSARYKTYETVFFARSYDLKAGTVKDRLCAARPTMFIGVPLVWEKIADKMRAIGASVTGPKKTISTWAKGVALQHSKNCLLGGDGSYPFGYTLADKLVLSKIKANLGLDECIFGFTGAAPIRVDTLEYFGSLGLQINEVYGMSECTGAVTWSTDQAHQWGSCGWAMPGQELKAFIVDPQDLNKKTECPRAASLEDDREEVQGELCFRGRNTMMGYLANIDFGEDHVNEINKKTAETIDEEGWLHSGDKGMVTEQGMVKITGRYKELIIGEGGENIAPVPIEDHVKKMCDGINEVIMIGDKRKYNVALVTLKAKEANGETPGTDDLDAGAKRVNAEVTKISEAVKDQTWIDTITAAITSANNNPKVCHNQAFKIQKFSILLTNFSEQENELTPTKKLKRKVVEQTYHDLIEKMYKTDGVYIPCAA